MFFYRWTKKKGEGCHIKWDVKFIMNHFKEKKKKYIMLNWIFFNHLTRRKRKNKYIGGYYVEFDIF